MTHLPQLIQIFAQVLEPEEQLAESSRKQIQEFLQSLQAHHSDDFQQMLTSLQESYVVRIKTVLRWETPQGV